MQQQRDEPFLADEVRVEVAARPAGGEGVVAGVDVVGADLVARDDVPGSAQRGHQAGGDRRLAVTGRRGGDDESRQADRSPMISYHSMPRWPFCPASMGCLTLVISVTRSAISTSLRVGAAAGDDDVLVPGPAREGRDDVVDVDPAPLHRIGELVEDVEVVALVGEPALDLRPALGGRGGVVVVGAGLARPRPARAHLVPLDRAALAGLVVQLAEPLQHGLLADAPLGRLHELEDADSPALVPAAQREPERGGRLALAVAGVHHQQRPVAALPGGEPVVGDGARLPCGIRPPSSCRTGVEQSSRGER